MGCCESSVVVPGCELDAEIHPTMRLDDCQEETSPPHGGLPKVAHTPRGAYGITFSRVSKPGATGDGVGFSLPQRPGPRAQQQQRPPEPCDPGPPISQPRAAPRPAPHLRGVPELFRLQYREVTPDDYELLCLLDETLQKRNTVSLDVISRLPSIIAGDASAAGECQICLGEVQARSRVVQLPCGHAFHQECISRWLSQCKGTCPLCLSPIRALGGDAPLADPWEARGHQQPQHNALIIL